MEVARSASRVRVHREYRAVDTRSDPPDTDREDSVRYESPMTSDSNTNSLCSSLLIFPAAIKNSIAAQRMLICLTPQRLNRRRLQNRSRLRPALFTLRYDRTSNDADPFNFDFNYVTRSHPYRRFPCMANTFRRAHRDHVSRFEGAEFR